MKNKFRLTYLIPLLAIILCLVLPTIQATDEYIPSYIIKKTDDFEFLAVGDRTGNEAVDFFYHNTNMFWTDSPNIKETKDPSLVLSGEQSMMVNVGAGDSTGWSSTFGITDKKIGGSEGGYLLKLELLVKFVDIDRLVIHMHDNGTFARYQEAIVLGDYTDGVDASGMTQNEDTEVYVEKLNNDKVGDYAKVTFITRGFVQSTMYYQFDTRSTSENAKLIIDEVVFSVEQKPEVPHRDYNTKLNVSFNEGTVNDTIFTGTSANLKEAQINTERPILGSADLKLIPSIRNKLVTLRSTNIELQDLWYKLFFKFKESYTNKVGVYVKDAATNLVIYDFIINTTTDTRDAEVANVLFDASNYSFNSENVWTCYGEFDSKGAKNIYLELVFQVTNINGYAIFDDITLLEQYTVDYGTPTEDNDPEKVVGILDAIYKDLDNNELVKSIRNVFTGDDKIANIFKLIGWLAVGLFFAFVIICKVKYNSPVKQKSKISVLLFAIMLTLTITSGCSCSLSAAPSGYNVVTPEKIDGKLDNPGLGWVMLEESTYGGHVDLGSSGTLPEVDNVSLSTSWAHIEIEEGVYDFTLCDQTIDYWTSLGKRINLRICTDNLVLTYTYKGVPDYLFEKYNVNYKYVPYSDPGAITVCRVVDIRDANYLRCLDNFLTALYEHYKDNKMVDTVEVRGFGTWGEWHTGWQFENKAERIECLDNILHHYYAVFKDSGKQLCVSSAWDPDYTSTNEYYLGNKTADEAYMNYVNWSSFDTAWRIPGMSYRRDSGGALLRYDLDERIMAEAFRSGKRVPLYGEYATSYYNVNSPGNAFNLMSAVDDILYKMRPNYITCLGWVAVEVATIVENGDTEFMDRANKMLGYRLSVDTAYVPQQVTKGGTFEVLTKWNNTAVGIFPYKTALDYVILDESGNKVATIKDNNFDGRILNQGEITNFYSELQLPENLENGKYSLAVSIDYDGELIALGMAGETATDSRIYKLSDFEVVDKAKNGSVYDAHLTYEEALKYSFDKNSTYEITFRYQPGFDLSKFYFGTSDSYKFSLQSKSKNSEVGVYHWQDVSGEIGYKTVTVATGNASDYKLKIQSINFDNIYVDDVWIKKVEGEVEDFSKYEMTDASTIIQPINSSSMEEVDEGIDGRSILLSSSNTNKQHILAKIDTNNMPFEVGKTYTITFDFRAEGTTGNGGYYFLASGDYSKVNRKFEVFGEWYERADNFDTKKTFAFTPTEEGQTVAFGVNASGNYYIDNLIITTQETTHNVEGTDLGYEHNVTPTHNAGIGITETFESGAFQGSGFEWAQFAWGRMTTKDTEVVNPSAENTTSLLCRIEAEAYNPETDNVWFEFTRSKLKYYKFEPEEYYLVEFDYKILKQFSGGKLFCFFRDDTLADRFDKAINDPYGMLTSQGGADLSTGKKVGEVYHYAKAFKIGASQNYQFMMCANGLWEASVDNIKFTKVTEQQAKEINGVQ